MFEVIEGFDERTVAVRASGKVTAQDYERVLRPLVDDATVGGGKARLYLELGPEFAGYEPSGMVADAALGLGHLGSFERMAVVTDVGWIRDALGLFGRLIPGEVRVFQTTATSDAREWVAG